MSYRIPPKPDYFDTVPAGTCRWCNTLTGLTPTGRVKKSRWHKECLREYKLLFWWSETKREAYKRDKGICNLCKKDTKGNWELDHIKPLYENKEARDLSFWQMGNLQTLCVDCHKTKSSAEAKHRAEQRKKNASK